MLDSLRDTIFGKELEEPPCNFGGWSIGGGEESVSEALPWIEREETEATGEMSLGSREIDGGYGLQEGE